MSPETVVGRTEPSFGVLTQIGHGRSGLLLTCRTD